MFKVGDYVVINPRYRIDRNYTAVRGIITTKTVAIDPDYHEIDWEDGSKGATLLNPSFPYLMLV